MLAASVVQRRLIVPIAWLLLAGCGSEMKVAPVTGTVMLDGKPLVRASVTFQPKAGGRPSFGVTDASGQYALTYSMHEQGAEVGECSVKVTTRIQAENTEDDSGAEGRLAPERVPARYAANPVVVDVKPQNNTIDISLTTSP